MTALHCVVSYRMVKHGGMLDVIAMGAKSQRVLVWLASLAGVLLWNTANLGYHNSGMLTCRPKSLN